MRGLPGAVLTLGLVFPAAASPSGPDVSYSLPPAGSAVFIRLENGQELSGVLLRKEDGATWVGVEGFLPQPSRPFPAMPQSAGSDAGGRQWPGPYAPMFGRNY